MKDIDYDTCFDIYGEEFYIIRVKYNSRFNINIVRGRNINSENKRNVRIVLTKELMSVLDENKSLHASKFGEHLSMNTIKNIRRMLLKNPYKDYQSWRDSPSASKPKYIAFLNRKQEPEYLADYFGDIYVLASAEILESGIIIPRGTLKDIFFSNNPNQTGINNKELIATKEIVDFVRKNRHRQNFIRRELVISHLVLSKIYAKLGYDKYIRHEEDMWIAARLKDILSMKYEDFVEIHMKSSPLTRHAIAFNFKKYVNALLRLQKSKSNSSKTILSLVRSMEDGASEVDIKNKLINYIPNSRGELIRPYRILMFARKYGHDIPSILKPILKKL